MIVVVDFEPEFGDVWGKGRFSKGGHDQLVDAFSAVFRDDVHEAKIGITRVFEKVLGRFNAGISRADEETFLFGYDEPDLGGGDHIRNIVVINGVWFQGWIEGMFGCDDALLEAEQRVEVCVSCWSDDDLSHG